jgi:nucleoside-diphosphate-sugar epimerase
MQRVLVTGGLGYVGSVLVPILLAEGYKVTVLDNLRYHNHHGLFSQVGSVPVISHPNFVCLINGDVRDEATVQNALKGQDAVIHLAAIVGAPACDKFPDDARTINADSTRILLKYMNRNQTILFASTGSCYGIVQDICTEDSPLNPCTLYGTTKKDAEDEVIRAGGIAFRFATAFGVSPRTRFDTLLNTFTLAAVRTKALKVYQCDARRTFIHVRDMARVFVFGLKNADAMRGNVYNVGDEDLNLTKRQAAEFIAKRIKQRLGFDVNVEFATEGSDPDQRDYEVSYKKIRGVGDGFRTAVSLSEGIDELITASLAMSGKHPVDNLLVETAV